MVAIRGYQVIMPYSIYVLRPGNAIKKLISAPEKIFPPVPGIPLPTWGSPAVRERTRTMVGLTETDWKNRRSHKGAPATSEHAGIVIISPGWL